MTIEHVNDPALSAIRSFSIQKLKNQPGLRRLAVINDFTALALSLPSLAASDLHAIEDGKTGSGETMALIGPGTGLGVSGLLANGRSGWPAINGEGGHGTLAATDAHEVALLDFLRKRNGHVPAERALSGPGLVNLYQAACAIAASPVEPGAGPADVIERSRNGDVDAGSATALFCGFLGSVASNLALTLGARAGLFIGGGIAPRLIDELRRSSFRQRFEDKGRMRDYLEPILGWVIHTELSPALLGAARALDHAT